MANERYGEEMRGDELPAELQRREKRLAAIAAAKARLEAADGRAMMRAGARPARAAIPREAAVQARLW